MSIAKLNAIIRNLFSNSDPTIISAKSFSSFKIGKWQYINNDEIRFKIIEFNDKRCVSITEWMEDSVFELHAHDDADEVVFIIEGSLHSMLDNISRNVFQKLFYKANIMHKIEGKKGTKISVEFTFI